MAKPTINIQDGFLFQALKAASPVSIELLSGRKIEGILKRFDRFSLILELDGGELLIYKHAVATLASVGGRG